MMSQLMKSSTLQKQSGDLEKHSTYPTQILYTAKTQATNHL